MTAHVDFEAIAAQIHEFYFQKYGGIYPARHANLPEFMKEDNLAAARRIANILKNAGLRLESCNGTPWTQADQNHIQAIIVENLEVLAEAEHNGWMEARLRQGWTPTDEKPADDAQRRDHAEKRLQYLLRPYSELEGKQKDKDRDSVQNHVAIVSKTEYRIVLI